MRRRTAGDELEAHRWGTEESAELYGPRHDYREELMLRRMRGLCAPGGRPRVLNAGCGAGSLTLKLLASGYRVTSIDASDGFVRRLQARIAELHGVHPAPVEIGDVCALRFADDSFDAVACGEVLEHLEDDCAAVREFSRVLRPGGLVVATVPANPWRYDWVDWWAGHRRRYTPSGLGRRFEEVGFGEVEVVAWGFPLTGLYERLVYKPLLRRRLTRGGADGAAHPGVGVRAAMRVVRGALELDTLFLGRRPGYLGLMVSARKQGVGPGVLATGR